MTYWELVFHDFIIVCTFVGFCVIGAALLMVTVSCVKSCLKSGKRLLKRLVRKVYYAIYE